MALRRPRGLTSGFRLEKWYLDCVTARGDVWVGYAAMLRWHRLRLRYASLLRLGEGEREPESRATLRGGRGPAVADGAITWSCPPLAVEGSWQPAAAPL